MVRITTAKGITIMTQLNYESAILIAHQTGGKLTADDVMNLCEYGTTNAQDMNPLQDELELDTCVCGTKDCSEEYAHTTSGC